MKNNKNIISLFWLRGLPQIVMFTEEGIYFEENVVMGLESDWYPTGKYMVADYDVMMEAAQMGCTVFVNVKPKIKIKLVEDEESSWLTFYHSSVIKMVDRMCDGDLGVFDEIELYEKCVREEGVDAFISVAEMKPVETADDARILWHFYLKKIAPADECVF